MDIQEYSSSQKLEVSRNSKLYFPAGLESTNQDPKKFWRIINNSLINPVSNTSDINIKTDSDEIISGPVVSEHFNNYFSSLGNNLQDQYSHQSDRSGVFKVYNRLQIDSHLYVTNELVEDVIADLNVHKGSGVTNVPSFALKDRQL